MAEFVMKKIVRSAGCEEEFEIASAATSDEELGNPVYPMARAELAKHGIGCPGKTARKLTAEDYQNYDMIIGMDSSNMNTMRRILGSDSENKMSLLLDHTDSPRDIADPWYTRDFSTAWKDIYSGCEALFNELSDSIGKCE